MSKIKIKSLARLITLKENDFDNITENNLQNYYTISGFDNLPENQKDSVDTNLESKRQEVIKFDKLLKKIETKKAQPEPYKKLQPLADNGLTAIEDKYAAKLAILLNPFIQNGPRLETWLEQLNENGKVFDPEVTDLFEDIENLFLENDCATIHFRGQYDDIYDEFDATIDGLSEILDRMREYLERLASKSDFEDDYKLNRSELLQLGNHLYSTEQKMRMLLEKYNDKQ
ncbi:hypothetical protein M3M33_09800 [Loigolactobacillus coryniformis]|uniref:hypothetical protein n=1 Tax=Loigolactobacillus coryniformis TaxID=1610 RepID=UPI00201B1F06|nr:hypothetical protein [Loigolactobacillus coryniformis]MCL5458945.1 hypothetical protein [Loigolactobacillus coryniformis]